jgi:transposase
VDLALPRAARRSRRSWSDEEKRRIVAQALCPGASVAEVARHHGVNANLLFNWCRAARAAAPAGDGVAISPKGTQADVVPAAPSAGFMPLGVFGRGPDEGPALIAGVAPARPPPVPAAVARSEMEGRPGLIEIDLANGTRLRVDAFVNERALQRVLSVLKATS